MMLTRDVILLVVLPITFILLYLPQQTYSKCAFTARDNYYNDSMGGNPPQPYSGEGFVVPPDYYQKLLPHCPHFKPDDLLCCNNTQIDKFVKNMLRVQVTLWHCPSCMNNYKRMWCDFTCNPNQGDFVEVNSVYPAPYEQYVQSVKFKVDYTWQGNFWDACKDNLMGAQPIRKQFASVQLWLQGVLNSDPPKPMVYYQFADQESSVVGYNGTVVPCDYGCVCEYCETVCKSGKQINPDFTCKIGAISCLKFGIIVLSVCTFLFALAVMTGIGQRVIRWYTKIEHIPKNSSNSEVTSLLH